MDNLCNVHFGEIYIADLCSLIGSVQSGTRPVLIAQNEMGNKHSPTVTVIPITSSPKKPLPTHIAVGRESGLLRSSTLMVEQIQTISKTQLLSLVGKVPAEKYQSISKALAIQCPFS